MNTELKETKAYRKRQLLNLKRDATYPITVKFSDSLGNQTNWLDLSSEEMNKIAKILAGAFKYE